MRMEQMIISRRNLLAMAGAALALAACGGSSDDTATTASTSAAATVGTTTASTAETTTASTTGPTIGATEGFNPLWIPPVLSGTSFDLTLSPSSNQLLDGSPSATIAYNGVAMWGPTLLMRAGDTVSVNVTNNLDEETTTHWHGLHLPAEMDGGPHQPIAAGDTWSPSWTVKNNAATYWYHPHAHELTWKQMNQGAGGFIIVQDDTEAALALPRTYGVDDIPLVLTSRTFDADNQIDTAVIYGDVLLANGVVNAELMAPAQMLRLRVLNAEIERAYTLGFADDRTFFVIGTDGGLLEAPVELNRLVMLPGERYELVVDLGADALGSAVTMQSFNGGYDLGYPGGEPAQSGDFGSLLNNTTFDVLRFTVTAPTDSAVMSLPSTLVPLSLWTAADATNERTVTITDEGPGTPFTFDDMAYDHEMIAHTVQLGTTEAWHIQNTETFSHSFHIHDVQFAIVSRSTGEVPAYERGWKDTLYIQRNELVTFVARFDDYASSEHPFMYHCHMSNHEDEGLMGQFLVVE
jgi:bilirubin oxidase